LVDDNGVGKSDTRSEAESKIGLFGNVFYSAQEVADLLGISVATARGYMNGTRAPLASTAVTARYRRVYGGSLAQFLGVDEPLPVQTDVPGLFLNAFYSPQDLGKMLGCSSRTVRRLIHDPGSGLSGSKAVGGRVRVYGATVADFMGVPRHMVPTISA
jgi:biotin operon repressor